MSCDGITAAVDALFLKRRYGIDSCSSDLDLDIADAKNQIERWKRKGGACCTTEFIITLPAYVCPPPPLEYCDPE